MKMDHHESFQRRIDESLAGAISSEMEESLRVHISTCASCNEYLAASNRVIAGLSGFSFELNPALNAKVLAALRLRARQVSPAHPHRLQLMRQRIVEYKVGAAFAVALILSLMGSALVYEVATLFHFDTAQVRRDVLVFWLLPSLCAALCLLAARRQKRGIA